MSTHLDHDRAAFAWLVGALSSRRSDSSQAQDQPTDKLIRTAIMRAEREGVAPLLHYRLGKMGLAELPTQCREELQRMVHHAVANELLADKEIRQVVATLAAADIPFLLLKGTPLAYCLYPKSYLRVRSDTDIIFPDRQMADLAFEVLASLGYQRILQIEGQLASYQFICWRRTVKGVRHYLDLHWQFNNSQRIACLVSFAELMAVSEIVPSLGSAARTLSLPYLLIHACVHRLAHRYAGDHNRLIWLYDIHLIGESLSSSEWSELITISQRKKIAHVCYQGLEAARERFLTRLNDTAMLTLRQVGEREPVFMPAGESHYAGMWAELNAIPRWTDRFRWLRENLFPSTRYMIARGGLKSRWQLPAAYGRRIVNGIAKRKRWRS